ncbi:GumC family protein [Roseovarius sp. E0-M6]|uniref:GumC family protein n=1 Tax=Roseovarius sp. E0-M6 TaxID=3127118 RepID=UPI00300FDE83
MQDDWYRVDENIRGRERQSATRLHGADGDVSLLSVALKHKLRLILTGLIATVLAYVALTQVTASYESSAQVLLEIQADPVIDIPNAVPEAPDGIATLESAVVLLRSPEIMRAVVEDLDLTSRAEFNSTLREPTPVDELSDMVSTMLGKVKMMLGVETPPVSSPRDPIERAARALRDNVSIRSIGESRVIEISTTSESASLAAQISNAIATQYIEHQIAVKAAAGERATNWLEERTNDARAQLEADEKELSEFGREMIVSERATTADLDAQLAELTTQSIQLDNLRSELVARRTEIAQLRAYGNYLTLASVAEVPTVTALVEQLAALDGTIVELNAIYGDHAKTREAQETRRQLITLLETETARLISGLDVRIGALEDRKNDLAREIREVRVALVAAKQDNFRLDALTREFETSRKVYERFLLRQKEVRQRSQFQSPGVRLVAEAERPSAPVAPQKAKLALLAGIVAGGGMLIYLTIGHARGPREEEEPAMETLDLVALNRMGTLVTLPHLPDVKHPSDLLRYFQDHADSELAISVNWLKSYLRPRSKNWTSLIMITSADRGEGKSTLSMLLAESFSRDSNTLLINADEDGWLTDFAQTEEFKRAGFGFLNYSDDILRLMDEELAIEDQLEDRRGNLLGADIVILDARTMPLSSGLLEIGQQADHTVFASAWNRSRLDRIQQCARALEEMGIAISALALTMMPRERQAALMQLPGPRSPLQLPEHPST